MIRSILRVFPRLIPRQAKFFDLFERAAKNLETAEAILGKMVQADSVNPSWEEEIVACEHMGDAIAGDLYKAEEMSFDAPFSKDHVRELTGKLDDALDEIEDAVKRVVHYDIVGDEMINEMIIVAARALALVREGAFCLRKLSKCSLEELRKAMVDCEHDADRLEFAIIKESYEVNVGAIVGGFLGRRHKNPEDTLSAYEYIFAEQTKTDYINRKRKRREIAEILERAVDNCRGVFHILGKIKSEM